MRLLISFFICLCFSTASFAGDIALKLLPQAQKIGTYSFSYLIWDVYDITLYAKNNAVNNKSDLALSLAYKRNIDGKDISQRSIEEIKGLGFKDKKMLQKWQRQMDQLFPDVMDGTILTGLRQNNKAIFYKNGVKLGVIDDPQFAQYFFDIWLSPRTSEPQMRRVLLGQGG